MKWIRTIEFQSSVNSRSSSMNIMKYTLARVVVAVLVTTVLTTGCSRESKIAKYQQRAEAEFKAGNYDSAEIEYRNLLRLDPANPLALRNLGLMSFKQGRIARAYFTLTEAAKSRPDDLEIRLRLAQLQSAIGKPQEARDQAVQILALQPTNSEALQLLVDTSLSTNDLSDVRQRLEALAGVAGDTAGYHVALGMLQLRSRDTNAALESFRAALSREPKSSVAHTALGGWYSLHQDLTNAVSEFKLAADNAPPRSVFPLRYADFLMGTGDPKAARELLEQVAKKTPDYLPVLVRLAHLALAERRFSDCEGAVKSLLNRDPEHLEGMITKARLRAAQNQPDQAVLELERALKGYPRVPQVHYQLAFARLMQNDLPAAANSLRNVLSIQPDAVEATLLLAELNIRRGETAEAVSTLTRLIERRPGLTQAYYLLANAQRAAGKLDAAIAIYDSLGRFFPTNSQPVFLAGLVQRQQGRLAEARKSFERALSLSPGVHSIVEQLLNLDLFEQQFAAARQRARLEIERNPTNALSFVLLAKVHFAETNYPAAETVLAQALAVSPESPGANALLAQVYVASRKHEAALKQLHEMVSRNTNDLGSWLMIAELNSAATNYSAARDAYEAILRVNPKSGPALNNLAWLCSEHLGDPKRAYELASQARDQMPQDPSTADTLGWVLYHNGDYVRALALIQESARVLSEQPEVLFHLGMTHYMMGEESAARVALQSALQLAAADAAWKPQARERLRVLDLDLATADAAALQELELLASRSARDPILLARLAAVAERQGAFERAAVAYEKALQINTNLVPVMVKLAQLYAVNPRNPERAFALARRARQLQPSDSAIGHTLGQLAYRSARSASDFKWAHSLLQESARALPDRPEVQFDAALASYAVGDVAGASGALRKVLTLHPPAALGEQVNQLLDLLGLAGKPAEAPTSAPRIEALLKQQPDYVPALMVSGVIQESQKDFTGARTTYERILKLFPLFTPATKSLALVYAHHLPDPQKAYEYATVAREAFPQDAQVARVLGGLAYQRGEFPRAVQLLKESAPAFANDAELFYTLGFAHHKLKQSRECKDALTRAIGLSSNSPQAVEAKQILADLK